MPQDVNTGSTIAKETPMNTSLRAALLTAAALAAAACASTSFSSTWRAPDAKPGTFRGKKVVAVFVSQDEALRRGVEETLAAELTRRGAEGVPAYSIIPTPEIRDEAKAKARITESGAAGVVALRLVGREQELSGSPAGYYAAPPYTGVWGGYWGYGWGGIYDPGYLRTDTVIHVETLVYSLEQNKLVWAGQSKTTNPESVDAFVKELVTKVAAEMKKLGLIKQG
jgi:hypothetical protein